jgi:type IV pilus assembly protein PilO
MATAFKDWPWPLQALFYLALTVVIIGAGFYIPGLPLASVRAQLQDAQKQEKPLEQEVASLRVYKQRKAELQSQMDALEKQLATLQTIVPEKQIDQFMLMIQSAASSSGVALRRMTAKPVAAKTYYFELPFEVEADGPYFSVLDFFSRLGRLSRIINVGDLKLSGLSGKPGSANFRLNPGASVTGVFTITTFFTKAADVPAPAATPTAAPARR